MIEERERLRTYRLMATRLNRARETVYECLIADELTADLRKRLFHDELVLSDYVDRMEQWGDAESHD